MHPIHAVPCAHARGRVSTSRRSARLRSGVKTPGCLLACLLGGLGCSSSSDTPSVDEDDGSIQAGDSAVADDAASPRDASQGPSDGSASPADAATNRDAEADASQDAAAPAPPPITATYVYQGGDNGSGSPYPFKTFQLNRTSGALSQVATTQDMGPKPTYIAPSSNGRFLYAANEADGAGVTAGSIGTNHTPSKLETAQVESGDSNLNAMVFTSLSPNGKFVLAANYYGGSVSVFPVQANGSLGEVVRAGASGPSISFAGGAAALTHSVRVDPTGKWAFAPNRGSNNIAQMKFDSTSGVLTANTPEYKASDSGAGPRHIAFHPTKPYAYVVNEDNSTISAYRVNTSGLLEDIETKSTLPVGQADGEGDHAAHVLVHPNGKYVYASNRGDDSIAVFSLAADGAMALIEHESSRGQTPRNFDIDSEGELMVVANQTSGNIAVLKIAADGKLSPLGEPVDQLPGANAVAIVNVRAPQ
jgi:6-phosphogluconolactonase